MYMRYRFYFRRTQSAHIFRACRLFQEILVDSWAATEQNRLGWIRSNQDTIRSELYHGVVDALASDNVDLESVGRRFILPASVTGSARYMQREYQDAMALCRRLGHPTLFITFTANPKTPEILSELLPDERPEDRPDIVCRVFHIKVKAMLKEIDEGLFGKCIGTTWTIEYQKRGLPHLHLLVYLSEAARAVYNNPTKIDEVVRAEIPDPVEFGEQDANDHRRHASTVVKSSMVHGPCGSDYKRNCPCLKQEGERLICTKDYPKPFCEATVINADGYPTYRRRQDAPTHQIPHPRPSVRNETMSVDSRWIVPHSPYLCSKYDAHINVEFCNTISAIKYLFKYVYKGSDAVTVQVDHPDEITEYLNARYIGPMEAMNRFLEYATHATRPAVIALAVHLPELVFVRFDSHADRNVIQQQLRTLKRTTLEGWFEYNRLNSDGHELRYDQFPDRYVWHQNDRTWKPRQRGGYSVARVAFVTRKDPERFYLRLLLTVVTGATSFEDVRTVDGVVHPTFVAAARQRGLVQHDREWELCFDDAILFSMASALRSLFVFGLSEGMEQPLALWEKYQTYLYDDLKYQALQNRTVDNPRFDYVDRCLYELSVQLLRLNNQSLTFYGLPAPQCDYGPQLENRLIQQEMEYNHQELGELATHNYAQLNHDQKLVFDTIRSTVDSETVRSIYFVQGPAGTGKTFVWQTLCAHYRSQRKIVLCVASTGIAALLLPGGRTAHSRFSIPARDDPNLQCTFSPASAFGQLLLQTHLIIWDEVPMQSRLCFEAVHTALCDVKKVNPQAGIPFGGIPVIMGGDWAQTLPVVQRGSRADMVSICLQRSHLWQYVQILHLRVNMRLGNSPLDREYAGWLSQMSYTPSMIGSIRLPEFIQRCPTLPDLIDYVFPTSNLEVAAQNFRSGVMTGKAILSLRNDRVTEINQTLLRRFPGREEQFLATDTVDDTVEGTTDATHFPLEYLRALTCSSIPLGTLELKLGTPIMLMRNLNPSLGLCNGTRMIVIGIRRRAIHAMIIGGEYDGHHHFLPRIHISTEDFGFKLTRHQFPIRLAFAMTVNKSQGQSLSTVGLDLQSPPFSHGQLYVGLSRVTKVENLRVLLPEDATETWNEVYPEVLQQIR